MEKMKSKNSSSISRRKMLKLGTGTTAAADTQVLLVNETSTSHGLIRGDATTKTWTNGTGSTTTKIESVSYTHLPLPTICSV